MDVTAAAAVAHSWALLQSAVIAEKSGLTRAESVVLVAENMISRTLIWASDVKLRLEQLQSRHGNCRRIARFSVCLQDVYGATCHRIDLFYVVCRV